MASVALARLLHRTTIINIKGESYRLKDKRKAGLFPLTPTQTLRTCEKITKCRVAAGFLAWPRREGDGNTRSGVADALHRPAGCLR